MAQELSVVPPALRVASGIIERHAQEVASAPGSFESSTDAVGLAAASVHEAFHGFCGALSKRLFSASAGLLDASDAFTAMDNTNCKKLISVVSEGDMPLRKV